MSTIHNLMPRALGLGVLLVLASCQAATSTQHELVQLRADLPAQFANAATDAAGIPVPERWWDTLADPVLAALVEEGLAANLDLQQADERVRQSRALAGLGELALLPSGGVALRANSRQSAVAEFPGMPAAMLRNDTLASSVELRWELDLSGRIRQLAEAGRARSAATAADAMALRLAVSAEIASAWFALDGARAQLAVAQEIVASWSETVDIVAQRVASGLAAPVETERMTAELAAAQARVPALETALAGATHRLAVLLGRMPADFRPPVAAATAPVALRLQIPAPADWVARRPDLQAAEDLLRAQELEVGAIRAEFLPRFDIAWVLGFVAGSLSGLGAGDSDAWNLVPGVSLPVFDNARIGARLAAANARQREALLAYRQRLLIASEEVENALARVHYGQLQLGHLARSAASAANAQELANVRYQSGAADLMELLDARRVHQSAELSLVQATSGQRQAVVLLLRALGSGFAPLPQVASAPGQGNALVNHPGSAGR